MHTKKLSFQKWHLLERILRRSISMRHKLKTTVSLSSFDSTVFFIINICTRVEPMNRFLDN